VFACEECGTKVVAPKKNGRTHRGHVKHMYCHVCRKETAHIQIED